MYIPTSQAELRHRGVTRPDVILISGDTYIDSPCSGIAIIGRVLEAAGFSVAIIAQPRTDRSDDITLFGEPRLCWGVTAGCVDSSVANYTALGKPRRSCDFTPGNRNDRRPHRATIAYTNLIRRYFKSTVPIVLGGIEASLRRIAHYDYISGAVRRSVLLDAKADILVYGMGERAILNIVQRLEQGEPLGVIPGTCTLDSYPKQEYVDLPPYEEVAKNREAFGQMFSLFSRHNRSHCEPGLNQRHGHRYLLHHPPAVPLDSTELDHIYELPYMHNVPPAIRQQGEVRALHTIRHSITTHRGCYGQCSFCAIALHQGRCVVSRSSRSIVREAQRLTQLEGFRGTLPDLGGPTANMYGSGCQQMQQGDPCAHRYCIGYDGVCPQLKHGHRSQMQLLQALEAVDGIKSIRIASGIRFDLILADVKNGRAYLEQLVDHHLGGQMKIAPEHSENDVLQFMNKPRAEVLQKFVRLLRSVRPQAYLSCYVIAAHPGCTKKHMENFARFARRELKFVPEQVQVFTPTPSTLSTTMFHSELDPGSGNTLFCEKGGQGRQAQREAVAGAPPSGKGARRQRRFRT
ncbi:YgiQ family radical SAM protein [Desulfurispira natronophila]|uniref:Putative radical SAM protein YgiQ n=1 Tax=Desulfurispira natronophila TaxID=682562 RepID=A0A7W7Y352_9BACT|nr:YgiQ family radical SAM protein [Desulfurispira natronophila]MBB5021173.1 putative radical SAM protein YgiQ [Desulfurispira natronophila]